MATDNPMNITTTKGIIPLPGPSFYMFHSLNRDVLMVPEASI